MGCSASSTAKLIEAPENIDPRKQDSNDQVIMKDICESHCPENSQPKDLESKMELEAAYLSKVR